MLSVLKKHPWAACSGKRMTLKRGGCCGRQGRGSCTLVSTPHRPPSSEEHRRPLVDTAALYTAAPQRRYGWEVARGAADGPDWWS